MLVLTRKKNESVVLTIKPVAGNDVPIIIELVDIKHGQVRIGIDAPDCVNILRSELLYMN
ncbi:MAG: carbon storage regulator [Sulfuriflexus sp.]|nr:carbon storage regulator [Sulfuriflexus sp.]